MSNPYIGEIRMGGWNFAPAGWAFCDGATQAISQNETLFNLIGTTYGGDGQTTFCLPDFRGRIPIHIGQSSGTSNYTLAQIGGVESVTLTTQQIPQHFHPLQGSSAPATSSDPTNLTYAASAVDIYGPATSVVTMNATTTPTGGNEPHDNFMPYLCVAFVISLFGIYPSPT